MIICGDLNAKNVNLGCNNNNNNGNLLEDLLLNTNLLKVNNEKHTFHRISDNSYDTLDWCLLSHNLYEYFISFQVLNKNLVDSDHYPIQINMQFDKNEVQIQELNNNNAKNKFNYNKANWSNFRKDLEQVSLNHISSLTIDELNEFLINEIAKARDKNIPKHNSIKNKILPEYIVNLIKQRKVLKSMIKNKKIPIETVKKLKSEYNLIKKTITEEINALENSKWNDFIKKIGKNPTSCAPFWKRINLHKTKQTSIKTLLYEDKAYHTNSQKANLFADIMATTFDLTSKNDTETGENSIKRLKEKLKNNKDKSIETKDLITKEDLEKSIKDLNKKTRNFHPTSRLHYSTFLTVH